MILKHRLFQHRIVRFAIVGGFGFLVDLAVFSLFLEVLGVDTFVARVIAFICAATATWFGNRTLTFSDRKKVSKRSQWKKSLLASSFSALPNLGVFKLTLMILGDQGLMPYVALVVGILVGMFSNYFLSSKWVFADKVAKSQD